MLGAYNRDIEKAIEEKRNVVLGIFPKLVDPSPLGIFRTKCEFWPNLGLKI